MQMSEASHRTTEYVALRLHCALPCIGIDVHSFDDRRQALVDVASLIVTNSAAGPVD
jgi:hypothetical protein